MHRLVEELLDDRPDHLFPRAVPYSGVRFYLACYSFYGHAGELQVPFRVLRSSGLKVRRAQVDFATSEMAEVFGVSKDRTQEW